MPDQISAPHKLTADHDPSEFESTEPSLDDWLKRRALKNEESGASRTYVITANRRVIGYYALATGAIAASEAPGKIRRNMPDPIPVMILGRLAIDKRYQGRGLGSALLRDAVLRILLAADIVGIRAILVHAVSEDARHFYERHGFLPSPINPMTLMITLRDVQAALGGSQK